MNIFGAVLVFYYFISLSAGLLYKDHGEVHQEATRGCVDLSAGGASICWVSVHAGVVRRTTEAGVDLFRVCRDER